MKKIPVQFKICWSICICVTSLMKGSTVVSCIISFLLIDRFMPTNGSVRERIVTFIEYKAEEVAELEDWNQKFWELSWLEEWLC